MYKAAGDLESFERSSPYAGSETGLTNPTPRTISLAQVVAQGLSSLHLLCTVVRSS